MGGSLESPERLCRAAAGRTARDVDHAQRDIAAWRLLFSGVLGLEWFPRQLAWWAPGAAAVPLPGFVSAYVMERRMAWVLG